ncbi:MAG: type II secretion protein F [candidate division TM6 bacterium GW2011_GWF2_37_49]|nr:MAG: type II secretion protein F [candidate division TM6 bacterium GW2011_GWF2_37_49]
MPNYFWKGIDFAGKELSGYRFAGDVDDLKIRLLAEGIAILSAKPKSSLMFKINNIFAGKSLSVYEFAAFFEQLAILISGGVELLTALRTISSQTQDHKIKNVVESIGAEVERGNLLSVALTKSPDVFDEFIIEMIRVGQASEQLALALTELSESLKKKYELRRDLINSAAVPLFTLFFAFAIILAIFIGVVPQFQNFFVSLGKNIPSSTQKLLAISNFLRSRSAFFCVGGMAILALALSLAVGKVKMKKFKDSILLNSPFFSRLIVLSDLTGFLQSLSLLLKSGLPLIDAILTAKSAVGNYYLKEKINEVADQLTVGKSLTESLNCLQGCYKFEMLSSLIRVGEKAGNLDAVLDKASQFFGNELKRSTVLMTSLFQPLLLVIVGLIVGVLIWIIYLPIINLAYSLS